MTEVANPELEPHAVQCERLVKRYGALTAVDEVSFDVRAGEIFGLVGPNGAGKTTTIECIEGFRKPDSGSVRVMGLDPQHDRYELRERMGVQFQSAALPPRIRVEEALSLFASFYRTSVDWRPLLVQLALADKQRAPLATLSGGQKQRVFIALALVNDPDIVFFDELTSGLDPQSRRSMWELVADIRERGKTVFLTTHFMEEAERLCDRVAIMDHGRLVALDSPRALIASLEAGRRVVFQVDGAFDDAALRALPGVTAVEQTGERVTVSGEGDRFLSSVAGSLESGGVAFRDLRTEQPNLEDVFLVLTGKKMRE